MVEPQPEALSYSGASARPEPSVAARALGTVCGSCGALLSLPAKAWARLLVLLCGLAVIKTALIAQLGKQIFETHWRVAAIETCWGDYVAFAGFVCLGVVSLIKMGVHCRLSGVRAVRGANALVLVLGMLFIFLTSHSGENNYLYPILTGVLKWSSLGPYLSLDWFFHAPFLGAWVFIYALAYYVLARTGHESWMLFVTAAFAGLYGVLYLRELANYRYQLWVIDCLGLVSLATGFHRRRHLSLLWAALPACWGLMFAIQLLRFAPTEARHAVYYFWSLLAGAIAFFLLATVVAQKNGFGQAWKAVAAFYFAGFLLLTNSHYAVSTNYSRILCLGFEFPRYFTSEVLAVAGLAICVIGYSRISSKARLWWVDLAALGLIAMTLVDFRLSQIMGVRLEWNVLALGNDPKMIWKMAAPYLPATLGVSAVICALYFAAVNRVQRAIGQARLVKGRAAGVGGISYAVACFVALGLLGIAATDPDKAQGQAAIRLAQTSPLWKRWTSPVMGRKEFLEKARALGLGHFETEVRARSAEPGRDLNVVLVVMESTFNKHLSLFGGVEETQPLLSRYKDRMELFPNFFSTFASSIHARFALFTSLYPIQDYNAFTLDRVPVKSIFEVLHETGYSCSMFYSSFADFTGFRDFLKQRGIDELYDADNMPGARTTQRVAWGLREEETLGAMKSYLNSRASDHRRFFMTYVPAAPHEPFEQVPARFEKFRPGERGDRTPAYLNQLLYMDWVLASLLDELKVTGLLEKTLVVITDDHGELLGENRGPIGHGWILTPELANAPLIIMDPQKPGYRVNRAIGSQVDLMPTILDLLRIPAPADELYEGRSVYTRHSETRRIYSNSYQQYGIIEGNRFLAGDREQGEKRSGVGRHKAYRITNAGAQTIFSGCEDLENTGVSIREFDKFQESLLRNYFFYRSSIRKSGGLASNN